MKRKLKHPRKRLIAFAICSIFALIGLNAVVDNPYTHSLIRDRINQKMAEFSSVRLNYQTVKIGLFPPKVEIYGTQLVTAKSREKIISTSRITLKISPWALFLAQPRIGILEIYDLDCTWPLPEEVQNFINDMENKNTVTLHAKTKMTWPPQFEFPLSRIKLWNAQFKSLDEVYQGAMEGVDLDFSYNGWNDLTLDIRIASTMFSEGGRSILESAEFVLESKLRKNKAKISKLHLGSPRITLDGNGEMNLKTQSNILSEIELLTNAKANGSFSLLGSILDIERTSGDVDATASSRVVIPTDGRKIELNVDASGTLKNGTLFGFNLKDGKTELNVNLERIEFKNTEIYRDNKAVVSGGGKIYLNDSIDFSFGASTSDLKFVDLLNVFDVDFNVADFAISGPKLTVKGRGSPLLVNALSQDATLSKFDLPATPYERTRLPESPVCQSQIQVVVDETKVDFKGTNAVCKNKNRESSGLDSRLDISGTLNLSGKSQGINLGIKSEQLDLGITEFFTQIPSRGNAIISTLIHGPFSNIKVTTSIQTEKFVLGGLPLNEVSGDVVVEGEFVKWSKIKVNGESNLVGSFPEGRLHIPNMMLDTSFRLRHLKRESLDTFIANFTKGFPFSFSLNHAEGRIYGPLFKPLQYQGILNATFEELTYSNERLTDEIKVNIQSDNEFIAFKDSQVILGSLVLLNNVKISRKDINHSTNDLLNDLGLSSDSLVSWNISTKKLSNSDKAHLQRLPFIAPYLVTSEVDGVIELNANLQGTLKRLNGTLQGGIRRFSAMGARLASIEFLGTVSGSNLDLKLSHGGSALRGRLIVDILSDKLNYEWFLSAQRVDLRSVLTKYLSDDPRNYVYLSGAWEMKGALLDWWRSKGKLRIDDVIVRIVSEVGGEANIIEMKNDQSNEIVFEESGWKLPDDSSLLLTGEHVNLRFGLKNCHPPNNFNAQIGGVFDLALLGLISNQVESTSGRAQIDGIISGNVSNLKASFEASDVKPSFHSAQANWAPVSIGISSIRPPIRNINFKLSADNAGITIKSFEGDKGSGKVSVRGQFRFASNDNTQEEETRITVEMDQSSFIFPVAFLKNFDATMSGTVTITGTTAPYLVDGNVVIHRARSSKEVDIRKEIINSFRSQASVAQSSRLTPNFKFDVAISADQSINIINRNLQMLMSTQLQLRGSDAEPSLSGQIEIDRGKFVYRREFTVTKGLIIFDDPLRVDPGLDISALNEVSGYRVFLNISGRASNPTIDLSIDPPTGEDGSPIRTNEILVLLSSGRLPKRQSFDVASLQSQRAESERAAQDAATAEALNLIVGQFEDQIEKLFDVSTQSLIRDLYVDAYVADTGEPVTRFNAPLSLAENLDLILKYDKTKTEISSELSLHQNIFLSSSLERQSEVIDTRRNSSFDGGVDLRFRFSFQ